MSKKSLFILMAMIVFFTFSFAPVQAITTSETVSAAAMKASQSLISMTEEREIEVTADLGYSADLSKLQWTLGGKPLDQWKQWDPAAKKYSSSPYISFSEPPAYIDGTTKIKAKLKFSLLYGTEDVSPRNLRKLYTALIGTYELAVKDPAKGQAANVPLKWNVSHRYETGKTRIRQCRPL